MFASQMFVATFTPEGLIEAGASSHPNEMKFSGTLVRLDEASTKAPNGSRGHKILIPKALGEAKVKTLIGMGVNYSSDLEKHQPTNKVGVIKKAWVDGNAIKVSGVIWKKDFPAAERDLKQANLGMSFEASDIDVEDEHADVWRLSNLCFTGAAILYKASAAYFKTEALAASAVFMSDKLIKKTNGGDTMPEKNKKKPSVAASSEAKLSVETIAAAMAIAIKPLADAQALTNKNIVMLNASIEDMSVAKLEAEAGVTKVIAEEEEMESEADDEEDDMDSSEDVDAAKKDDKEDDMDDEDEDDMDSSADDEDELDCLDEPERHTDNSKPGFVNSKIEKKGDKTTVSTKGDKHKSVKASAVQRLTKVVTTLQASVEELKAENVKLKRELKASKKEAISASAREEGRRSAVSNISAGLVSLLGKEGIDPRAIMASGEEPLTVNEFDAILAKASNLSVNDRMAMKNEAVKLGVMAVGQIGK